MAESPSFDQIQKQIINDTPSVVPKPIFIRYLNQTSENHSIYDTLEIEAKTNISFIQSLDHFSSILSDSINNLYSYRSLMRPIVERIKITSQNSEYITSLALSELAPTLKKASDIVSNSLDAIDHLSRYLISDQIWKDGIYSSELLISFSNVISKLLTIDALHAVKHYLLFDISTLNNYFQKTNQKSLSFLDESIVKWLKTPTFSETQIVNNLKKSPAITEIALTILFKFIHSTLSNPTIICTETRIHLIHTAVFIVQHFPNCVPSNAVTFLVILLSTTPYLPLIHDFSINIFTPLMTYNPLVYYAKHTSFHSIFESYESIRENFTRTDQDLYLLINNLKSKESDSQSLPNHAVQNLLTKALSLISQTIFSLRVAYAQKLVSPPNEPSRFKPYERSVRAGYTSKELKDMLQLLVACRELHDLIRSNLDILYSNLLTDIGHSFENFIKETLGQAFVLAKHNKSLFRTAVIALRSYGATYAPEDNPNISMRKNTKKPSTFVSSNAPSIQLIEMVRIQLQCMFNPESYYRRSSNSKFGLPPLTELEEKPIIDFLQLSTQWNELISLEQTLSSVSDQSSFYFKEVQLDINNAVQFPARSSLPFVLCQFALDNYVQPELTEILFYPLSIYDDAAFYAINKLKSTMVFEEIKAEAKVCLDTLSVLIGEFTFNAFRTFVTMHQFPPKIAEILKANHFHHWPSSQAYRLRNLLQQNQYFLLSNQVIVKSLIAPRVDNEVSSSVKMIYQMATEQGITTTLAIDRMLEILRETHRLLLNQGLPLMAFEDIEKVSRVDASLTSFSSKFLTDVSSHLFKVVLRKFILFINPFRFLPPRKVILPSEPLGKLNLGKIVKDALEPCVAFTTVHHFLSFVRSIPESGFSYLCNNVIQNTAKAFSHFLDVYKPFASKIKRIKNPPIGVNPYIAFSLFTDAYDDLLKDPGFDSLLGGFKALGNSIAIAELLDEAFILKQINVKQAMSYLEEIDQKVLDFQFQDEMKFVTSRPSNLLDNSYNIMLKAAISEIVKGVKSNMDLFKEKSANKFYFPGLTGFPAIWSVISFCYAQLECQRIQDQSGYMKFGMGVHMAAGAISEIIDQTNYCNLLSISVKMRRILQNGKIDVDADMHKFSTIAEYGDKCFEYCCLFLKPYIKEAFNNS